MLQTSEISITADVIAEPDTLFQQLVERVTWDERFRSRKAASFGAPYNYSGVIWPELPFPTLLLSVLDAVSEVLGYRPNNCLAHFYPNGHSTMGFHFDETSNLAVETGIAVLSLGDERSITFRNEKDTARREAYNLPSGSLLVMTSAMQHEWKHAILGTNESCSGRISLTFRKLISGNVTK